MANMRAIKTRIKSIESTRQITKSMKMVSASKLRRTQEMGRNLKAFAQKSQDMLSGVMSGAGETDNPYLKAESREGAHCYVIFLGNRGLCGMYNTALVRYLEECISADGEENFVVACGRWSRDNLGSSGLNVKKYFTDISDAPAAKECRELEDYLKSLYLSGEAAKITLVYQHFKTVLSQEPARCELLPLSDVEAGEPREFIFEPDKKSVLDSLAELYISNMLYATLLEAKSGEHAARMTAMTSATDNTEELISDLTLQLNHARQAAITTEISEIVGGSGMINR